MSRRSVFIVGAWLLCASACKRATVETDRATVPGSPSVTSPSHTVSASTTTDARPPDAAAEGASRERDADGENVLLRDVPKSGRSIGHTSVVFKLEFEGGEKAVFKPASRRGPTRYKGEIAAYRLASALGLANVPPAYPRTFAQGDLVTALGGNRSPAGALLVSEGLESDAMLPGAILPWIERLTFLPVEADPLRSSIRTWLTRGRAIPETGSALVEGSTVTFEPEKIAAQVSTLVAFDFLTGNWDRYSGANVGLDRTSGTLLFIDNDGAFFENPPKDALQRNVERLASVDRFSRSFVEHVRALDDASLRRAFGEERAGVSLLSEHVVREVAHRRKELLDTIDAKIRRTSEGETLAFQ